MTPIQQSSMITRHAAIKFEIPSHQLRLFQIIPFENFQRNELPVLNIKAQLEYLKVQWSPNLLPV